MSLLHADEIRPTSIPDLLGMMKLVDRGGSHPIIVPQTMAQCAELIEALRARIERDEALMRAIVEAVAPLVDQYQRHKKLYPGDDK